MNVPNVNFFLKYVESMQDRKSDDTYVKKYLEERRFYGSKKEDDYIKYVNKGSKDKIDYVEYSGNNEKSRGVFNENGLLKAEEIKELRKQLRNTNSPIWHGVISFTEDFGNKYCNNYEKAQKLMKLELPKFFKNAGLNPDNIVWFAGLHENTDNKHIHLSFFEKKPERYRQNKKEKFFSNGHINIKAINKFKVNIEMKLLNLIDEMILHRKSLTDEMRKEIALGEYMKHINSLLFVIPAQNRMQYDSENMKPYRNQIDMVTNAIIQANKELKNKFINYDRFLLKRDSEIKNAYSKINVDYADKLLHDKCIKDIYKRLGNIVLETIKEIRREQKKVEYETKHRLILKRIEKKKRKILLNKCMRLNDIVNREIINAFEELRYKLQESNYKRLQEEGVIE